MLPPKCFTCGKFLADIAIEWEQFERDNMHSMEPEQLTDEQSKLLDKLGLKDMCCRAQVLTYTKLIKVIK